MKTDVYTLLKMYNDCEKQLINLKAKINCIFEEKGFEVDNLDTGVLLYSRFGHISMGDDILSFMDSEGFVIDGIWDTDNYSKYEKGLLLYFVPKEVRE